MKIKIFGLGAIGSNLFVQLVKQFPDYGYTGIDFDKVEDRNIRTQAYFREMVGQPKTKALMMLGMRYVKKLNYEPLTMRVDDKTVLFGHSSELWIDCFDNSKSRTYLKNFKGQPNLLHLGFSPLYSAECLWDAHYDVPNDVDPQQGDICSMIDAVGFIQMFVGLAMMTISEWVRSGIKRDFIVTHKNKLTWLDK